jgi:hypothetical protein
LNWERKFPGMSDLLMFVHPRILLWSAGAALLCVGTQLALGRLSGKHSEPKARREGPRFRPDGFILGTLWYLIPLLLFFLLAHVIQLNLFVERYLILASLPAYLLLPAFALACRNQFFGRCFLLLYLGLYVFSYPGKYFLRRGEFSAGIPGGNEWRETLSRLDDREFRASLLLFQSPFIESNRLEHLSNSKLFDYLSTPLRSFYVDDHQRPFVLLPVHWWIENPRHQAFKSEIARLLTANTDFSLFSTQEFWDYFEPWLRREFSGRCEWQVVNTFRSTGALGLRRIRWHPIARRPDATLGKGTFRSRGMILSCDIDSRKGDTPSTWNETWPL